MIIEYTPKFKTEFQKFPPNIRKKFTKQADFLLENLHHPSLYAKKYDEVNNIWQARVDHRIRFFFLVQRNCYTLLTISKHPK